MIVKLQVFLMFFLVFSQNSDKNSQFTFDEGETLVLTGQITQEILEIISDIDTNDQPTRIQNNDVGKVYYILEYQNSEYFLTGDTVNSAALQNSKSFLQIIN